MVVTYWVLQTRKNYGEGRFNTFPGYQTQAANESCNFSPSECVWLVPGTVDPMEA